MWTAPVPVSMVTKSAVRTIAVRGKKRMLRADAFDLAAGK